MKNPCKILLYHELCLENLQLWVSGGLKIFLWLFLCQKIMLIWSLPVLWAATKGIMVSNHSFSEKPFQTQEFRLVPVTCEQQLWSLSVSPTRKRQSKTQQSDRGKKDKLTISSSLLGQKLNVVLSARLAENKNRESTRSWVNVHGFLLLGVLHSSLQLPSLCVDLVIMISMW